MTIIDDLLKMFVEIVWGVPLLVLLIGGGIFFTLYGRLLPFRYFRHSLSLLAKPEKYAEKSEGQLDHRQALSTALAGTIGLGNIAGVALAISTGGPGAVFWMWLSALLGISTKFFTCSLGVMYRSRDKNGQLLCGPMYIVEKGLGSRWKPLALLFAVAGLFGTIPSFQANQLTAVVRTQILGDNALFSPPVFNIIFGCLIAVIVGIVVWGGLKRIANTAVKLVPTFTLIYFLMAMVILAIHIDEIPSLIYLIFVDAWQANSVAGGLLGIITIGVSRGVFSNEAGIGTEVMAHGAAKTQEPIREGLVASLGPIIDTLIVCTCTALVVIASGVWQQSDEGLKGVQLTMLAFGNELGLIGQLLLALQVLVLSLTTMFTYCYYGNKCLAYIMGKDQARLYRVFYLVMVLFGAVVSLDVVFNLMIGMYALMAIPTMVSTIILAPKVMASAKQYFASQKMDTTSIPNSKTKEWSSN